MKCPKCDRERDDMLIPFTPCPRCGDDSLMKDKYKKKERRITKDRFKGICGTIRDMFVAGMSFEEIQAQGYNKTTVYIVIHKYKKEKENETKSSSNN